MYVYTASSFFLRVQKLCRKGSWMNSGQVWDQFWTAGHQTPGSMMWFSSATLFLTSCFPLTRGTLKLWWVDKCLTYLVSFLSLLEYCTLFCFSVIQFELYITYYIVLFKHHMTWPAFYLKSVSVCLCCVSSWSWEAKSLTVWPVLSMTA